MQVQHDLGLSIDSLFTLGLNPKEYFFSVDINVFRRLDADSDLIAINADDDDFNIIADHDFFSDATGDY